MSGSRLSRGDGYARGVGRSRAAGVAAAAGASVAILLSGCSAAAPPPESEPVGTVPDVAMTLPPPPTEIDRSANDCPLTRTGTTPVVKIEKDLGLAAGTFHLHVLGPWKGHQLSDFGRKNPAAVARMKATVAMDLRLVERVLKNIHNDPVLCNQLNKSLTRFRDELAQVPAGIAKGHGAAIGLAQGALAHTLDRAASKGVKVREIVHASED